MRIEFEFVFERNTTYLSGFQVEEKFTSFRVGVYGRTEETCVSLGSKPSMLEEGVWSTLFPCEN
jgi:hypothetical protein